MTGEQRLKQLGLNPKSGRFISPNRNTYYFYWGRADVAYDEQSDSFRLLQDTGRYGGRGARWVKAKRLAKSWKQD